jgi:hypothetical protein
LLEVQEVSQIRNAQEEEHTREGQEEDTLMNENTNNTESVHVV